MTRLREVRAPNASDMTLDGTRTWVIGEREVAIIDAGPGVEGHVRQVARAVAGARVVAILLTHEHPDHAGGAEALAARVGAPIRSIARGSLEEGDVVATDAGSVVALHTPGHTPDHAVFHWQAVRAVFCGDLMMGGQATALVAPPEGDLAAYLASLERLRALDPAVIHPAHGPSFDDPQAAIDAYVAHRARRMTQVIAALADGRPKSVAAIAAEVYGGVVPGALRAAAEAATVAYLRYLQRTARVAERNGEWIGGSDQHE